jgi:uncharacterized protein YndB with AHSA1/START domain
MGWWLEPLRGGGASFGRRTSDVADFARQKLWTREIPSLRCESYGSRIPGVAKPLALIDDTAIVLDETLDPILIQVTIPLPIPMIFSAFTDPSHLQGWLCDGAVIEPRVGGRYELSWKEGTEFTSRGTITRLTPDVDIGFTWTAPPEFNELMNLPTPKTHVYVRLAESPEGIDVTLEHAGWESGSAWEDARSWHFHLWDDRLHQLKDYLIRVAYG